MRLTTLSVLLIVSSACAQSGPVSSLPEPQVVNVTRSASKTAVSNL